MIFTSNLYDLTLQDLLGPLIVSVSLLESQNFYLRLFIRPKLIVRTKRIFIIHWFRVYNCNIGATPPRALLKTRLKIGLKRPSSWRFESLIFATYLILSIFLTSVGLVAILMSLGQSTETQK